jgi:hypothetical protein
LFSDRERIKLKTPPKNEVKKNARELAMSEHGVWAVKKVYETNNDVVLLIR